MRIPGKTPVSYYHRPSELSSAGRRSFIFAVSAAVHLTLLLGPLAFFYLESKLFPPKKETAFKVKLGDNTPSVGPVVGPPERLRPSPEPPAPEPPAPEPPAPEPPAPRPEPPAPRPEPAIPRPKPRPKPKAKPKPRPKPKAKPKAKPKPRPKPKASPKAKPKPRYNPNRRPRNAQEAQRGVYRPTGRNTNRNVPIGGRDAAQVYGKKPDHGTPQGGLTPDEKAYQELMGRFLKSKWSEPPKSLLGGALPSTTIEISIAGDGRVLAAKIIKPSGNRVMDESVKRMISVLDRMPKPVNGRGTVIQFEMRTEE